ncbi:MAG: CoB--CoM heterodisulfide reductase iron-sulfur subunit B family protein [Bacillota bacterium]
MKYSYFPGCCYHGSAKEYEMSTRIVCNKIGIELVEVPDWNCCGATAGHSTDDLLAVALAARNLALAEETGLDVTAPCAACYQRLAHGCHEMNMDPLLREKVNSIIGRPFNGKIKVKSILDVFIDYGLEAISDRVVKSLSGVKAAAYYGCLMVRPASVKVDDDENPVKIDRILQAVKAETVDWDFKTECCGASLAVSNQDIVIRLTHNIIKSAVESGANCIVTACPLCHFNLDIRQARINRTLGTSFNLPVFYFSQLMGLALGIDERSLNLNTHFVDTSTLLKAI